MILDHHYPYLGKVKSSLSAIAAPLQYTVAFPIRVLNTFSESIISYKHLKQQNQELRIENLLVRTRLQKMLLLEQDNNQLRALLKAATPQNQTNSFLLAETLAVDADFFSHEILLDKGSKQGVYIGQAVADENGIMGQIIQATPELSRVLLISDSRSAISVQNYRTGMRGLLVGTGSQNHLLLKNIPVTADIKMGDLLLTSGLDGRYPSGYPVGFIQKIMFKPQEQFAVIYVAPKAKINRNRLVVLISPQKAQENMDETEYE
ncbi:MAG: Cell shape-determining protein MreC [Legionellaceae bacterium]